MSRSSSATAFGTGTLNPAFSVYRGLFGDDAHDDAAVDPLNPSHLVTVPPPPHVVKDPSPVDNGVTADGFGRVSPFRDTVNITFVGQFDALHTWSMANPSGDWAVVQYVAHAPAQGGNSVSLVSLLLPDGDYTIAAAGGTNCTANPPCLTNIDGTISFSATVAPDGDGDAIANGLDNCPVTPNPTQQNSDSDARGDACDNCTAAANTDAGTVPHTASIPRSQFDADDDGYGNLCDADINQSGGTTTGDYTLLRNVLNHFDDETAATCTGLCVPGNIIRADMNGSGQVTTSDYTLLRNRLNTPLGPSGLSCAGTVPCPSP